MSKVIKIPKWKRLSNPTKVAFNKKPSKGQDFQMFGKWKVFTAHRTFANFCPDCGMDITTGQYYVVVRGNAAHWAHYKPTSTN